MGSLAQILTPRDQLVVTSTSLQSCSKNSPKRSTHSTLSLVFFITHHSRTSPLTKWALSFFDFFSCWFCWCRWLPTTFNALMLRILQNEDCLDTHQVKIIYLGHPLYWRAMLDLRATKMYCLASLLLSKRTKRASTSCRARPLLSIPNRPRSNLVSIKMTKWGHTLLWLFSSRPVTLRPVEWRIQRHMPIICTIS